MSTVPDDLMTEQQHLYSEPIYRLNSELLSIRSSRSFQTRVAASGINLDEITLVPAAIDRHRRGFSWLIVDDNNWKWNKTFLEASRSALKGPIDQWSPLNSSLEKRRLEPLSILKDRDEDFRELHSCWHKISHVLSDAGISNWDDDLASHRALLKIVAGHVSEEKRFVEGLVLEMVEREAKSETYDPLMWVVSRLLDEYPHKIKPTAFICNFHSGRQSTEQFYSQTDAYICGSKAQLASHMSTVPHAPDGSWEIDLQNAMLRFDRDLRGMISVPIYDGGTPRDPCGRLVGMVHAMLNGEASNHQCKEIAEAVIENVDRLPTAFRTLARAQAASTPIDESRSETGVAAQHLLRLLPAFHDWEHVAVNRLEKSDGEEVVARRIECWSRGGTGDWERLKAADPCATCAAAPPPDVLRLEGLDQLLRMRWASKRDLNELATLRFEFKLPVYAIFPPDISERRRLYRQYKHELIDMFRLLLPKVQRHRYAVRTAAVAIMGRNMSHNIGSHVLSSVSAVGFSHRTGKVEYERRTNLIRYLQERMDFLAEVATTQHYMALPGQLSEVVKEFNDQTLLRKYITAVNSVDCVAAELNVTEVNPQPLPMALPGGRHGYHAFYVLIENIARNSAKHRITAIKGAVNLRVRLDELHPDRKLARPLFGWSDDSLLRIRIWDDAANGRALREGKYLFDYLNDVLRNQSIIDELGMLSDGNWGIRELLIAAAYLRRVDIEDIESFFGAPELLRALAVDDNGNCADEGSTTSTTHLCYNFRSGYLRI